MKISAQMITCLMLVVPPAGLYAQAHPAALPHQYTPEELERLLRSPERLEGYRSAQSGPLFRLREDGTAVPDTTFTVEHMSIPSEGFRINGWLYLPLGTEKHPLIVLTNGGGDGSRPIKSLPDWIAPILAHCGYAAFVHDKRGTGASEGDFRLTTYDDYILDAGNCARYLKHHPRIDSARIGVLGGSEGGRIAVVAASRFPEISFVISYAGTFVSMVEDRIYAQTGSLKQRQVPDSIFAEVVEIHTRSIAAWGTGDIETIERMDREIEALREISGRRYLPATRGEMERNEAFTAVLPTWHSLAVDYMTEMKQFRKRWLALFGAQDIVVPTYASVENIHRFMNMSGNDDYYVGILPDCGHAPVDSRTGKMIRLDHIVINWLNEHIGR
ncbi:alpha/beta hydrolase [bacterium]|nr:alpha/beta hydrolase [bacterium]